MSTHCLKGACSAGSQWKRTGEHEGTDRRQVMAIQLPQGYFPY